VTDVTVDVADERRQVEGLAGESQDVLSLLQDPVPELIEEGFELDEIESAPVEVDLDRCKFLGHQPSPLVGTFQPASPADPMTRWLPLAESPVSENTRGGGVFLGEGV